MEGIYPIYREDIVAVKRQGTRNMGKVTNTKNGIIPSN
jgi:hypothetical protein